MSIFKVLLSIRENAHFYSHAWSKKEVLAEFLLSTIFAERYSLHKKCERLMWKNTELQRENKVYSKKLTAALKTYAELCLNVEEGRPT